MLSLILLLFTLCLSALVVQVGAIALELTGIPTEHAKFQALSAFTGVGYTSRESEAIFLHPQRRRIIAALIRLGSAGVVTSIGTLAGTLVASPRILESLVSKEYLGYLPLNLMQATIVGVTVFLAVTNALLRRSEVRRLIRELIAAWLLSGRIITEAHHEEILITPDDRAIVRVDIHSGSLLRGRSLAELSLVENGIAVLSVQRLKECFSMPAAAFRLREGDTVLIYGDISAIRQVWLPQRFDEVRRAASASDEMLPLCAKAPEIALPDQDGELFRLSEVCRTRAVIVLFYPKDRSFYCSRILQAYARIREQLLDQGVEVVAINPASVSSHAQFCAALGAGSIRILSDQKKKVCRSYRALMLCNLLVNRSVYIIDREQRIAYRKRGNPALSEVLCAVGKIHASRPDSEIAVSQAGLRHAARR